MSETRTSSLPIYLQAEIERRGMTAAGLAAKASIPKPTISNLLNKPDIEPELATLDKLAQALGVPLYRLIQEVGYNVGRDDADLDQVTRLAKTIRDVPKLGQLLEDLKQLTTRDLDKVQTYTQGLRDGQRSG